MNKTLFKLFLAMVLVLGILAACSSGDDSSSDTDSSNGDSTSDESKTDSGDGGEFHIGANLELSGAVATYGSSIAEGIDLAVEEINEAGGINGMQIKVTKFDNKSDAAEATNGIIKLVNQDNVDAIIGAATSGNTVAQVQIANEKETILLTPSGTAPIVTINEDGSLNEYVFRTSYIDPFQGTIAANFAIEELGVKTAAIYADNASDYAKGLAAAFKETFEAAGGEIVAEEAYVAKDTDFRSTLTRINSANPEFVFIPGYYEEVGLIVAQAREIGLDVPLMGADGWDSPTLVELAGPEALNNTFITNHYSSEDPDDIIQNFVTKFGEKYGGNKPNAFHALGYDSVYLLKDAIERAGSTDSVAIKDALEATENISLVSGNVTIDENHNPVKSATILEYVDGEQVFKTKIDP